MLIKHSCSRIGILWLMISLMALFSMDGTVHGAEGVLVKGDEIVVNEAMALAELGSFPLESQRQFNTEPSNVRALALDLYMQKRLAKEAERLGITKDPKIRYAIERSRREILARHVLQKHIENLTLPDFAELAEEQYRANPEKYRQKEKVRIRQLVLRAVTLEERQKKQPEIEKLLAELQSGADFEAYVRKYSEAGNVEETGGDIGWLTRGKKTNAFYDAAFALKKVGDISPVIESRYGFHILQLEGRAPEHITAFAQVKNQIIEKLKKKYLSGKRSEYLAHFREQDKVIVDEQAIKALSERIKGELAAGGPIGGT